MYLDVTYILLKQMCKPVKCEGQSLMRKLNFSVSNTNAPWTTRATGAASANTDVVVKGNRVMVWGFREWQA